MKVLFWVEPYPIRNSMTHFLGVARHAARLLDPLPPGRSAALGDLDLRLYANTQTLSSLKELSSDVASALLYPTPSEQEYFDLQLADWDSCGLPRWLELISGSLDPTYYQVLGDVRRRFPYDAIIHWGENNTIAAFCAQMGVRRVAMELGCTRPPYLNSIVFDPLGTNGAAAPGRVSIQAFPSAPPSGAPSSFLDLMSFSDNLDALPYEQSFGYNPLPDQDLINKARKAGRLAYFPLQLYDDANLLCFSPFKTLADVVGSTIPQLCDSGFVTIIKPHPASHLRPGGQAANLEAKRALREFRSRVIWLEPGQHSPGNPYLFGLANSVITVNSSVGFEALFHNKPVCVLGNAVYKPSGVFPQFDALISDSWDRKAYSEAVSRLRRYFLDAYLVDELHAFRRDVFRERVVGLTDIYSSHRNDSSRVVASIYSTFSRLQRGARMEGVKAGLLIRGGTPSHAAPQKKKDNPPSELLQGCHSAPSSLSAAASLRKRFPNGLPAVNTLDRIGSAISTRWRARAEALRAREIILQSGLFDPEYYTDSNPDVTAAKMDPAYHFAAHGGLEGRRPNASFDIGVYIQNNPEVVTARLNPLVHLVETALKGTITTSTSTEVISPPVIDYAPTIFSLSEKESKIVEAIPAIVSARGFSRQRLAVVCHFYYADLVEELLDFISRIDEPFDLYATVPHYGRDTISRLISDRFPEAVIIPSCNRGRDIGPFMSVLPFIAGKYNVALKLHTKKGYFVGGTAYPELGDAWRNYMLASLLPSSKEINGFIGAFDRHSDLALLGPGNMLVSMDDYALDATHPILDVIRQKLFMPGQSWPFFAGSMFWFSPRHFSPLLELGLGFPHFEPESGANNGKLAHALERCFGAMAGGIGGKLASIAIDDFPVGRATRIDWRPVPTKEKIGDFLKRTRRPRPTGPLRG